MTDEENPEERGIRPGDFYYCDDLPHEYLKAILKRERIRIKFEMHSSSLRKLIERVEDLEEENEKLRVANKENNEWKTISSPIKQAEDRKKLLDWAREKIRDAKDKQDHTLGTLKDFLTKEHPDKTED